MATKERLNSKALNYDKDCPIQKLLQLNNSLMEDIKKRQGIKDKPAVQKKKSTTKAKKKYNVILKVACVLGAVLLLTLAYSTLFAPDVVNAIMVFFDFLGDPLKQFRGNGAVNPDNYVMFINNIPCL